MFGYRFIGSADGFDKLYGFFAHNPGQAQFANAFKARRIAGHVKQTQQVKQQVVSGKTVSRYGMTKIPW